MKRRNPRMYFAELLLQKRYDPSKHFSGVRIQLRRKIYNTKRYDEKT